MFTGGKEIVSQYVIDELKTKYKEKKIIPFIGAGLSIPFALKPWGELISELKECFLEEKLWPAIDADLDLGEYQDAIDDVKKFGRISEQPIQEKIADSYSINNIDYDTLPDCNYSDIIKDNFKIYLTTNYDELIKLYMPRIRQFYSLVDYTSNIQRLFDDNTGKHLFHIHGCVANPDSIVISTEKYNQLYSDENFDNLMKAFSSHYSFLFLGFSFNDAFLKNLIQKHKQYFKGTHYIITSVGSFDAKRKAELNREFGLKTIEYDPTNSSHVLEIRKIIDEITGVQKEKKTSKTGAPNNNSYAGIGIDELKPNDEHNNNLFYRKLKISNINPKMCDLSKFFYIASEKFIRTSNIMGLPKEFIDSILAEVFLKYQEKYIEIYDIQGKTSEELLIEIHKNLEQINIDRFINDSTKPTLSETKGFIHILADDKDKNVWWGNERL